MKKYFAVLTVFVIVTFVASCNFTQKKEKAEQPQNTYQIFILNDATRQGNADVLISPDTDTLKKYIPDGSYRAATNAVLVQRNDSNFLFDAGVGEKLVQNLDSHGIKPENVHKIFITHCHGDHIGGLLKDGQTVFPNSELFMNRVEYNYWQQEQNALFLQVIEKYEKQLRLFDIENTAENKTLFDEIEAVAAYGHTPGHTVYFLGNDENRTLIWGDITHVMPVQMPHPEYSVRYDYQPEQAAESRLQIFRLVADKNIKIAGMHVPDGIGNVKSQGNGMYVFVVPETVER